MKYITLIDNNEIMGKKDIIEEFILIFEKIMTSDLRSKVRLERFPIYRLTEKKISWWFLRWSFYTGSRYIRVVANTGFTVQ